MVEINYQILLIQMCSFLVAVFILWKIAWKPLTTFMANRQKSIADDINKANESKENALKLEEEYKRRLTDFELETEERINKAITEGENRREKIVKEALEEANSMIEHAKREIAYEKEHTKKELQNEVLSVAVLIAQKLIKETMDPRIQEKVLNDFISRLKNER